MQTLLPDGWPRPKGYSNGILAGNIVFVAGQIGWTPAGVFEESSFAGQFRQTLDNTLAILAKAGGAPHHIARMTWYVVDRHAYLSSLEEVGTIWRERMGRHYPALAVVEVRALMEDRALIEIESTAVIE